MDEMEDKRSNVQNQAYLLKYAKRIRVKIPESTYAILPST